MLFAYLTAYHDRTEKLQKAEARYPQVDEVSGLGSKIRTCSIEVLSISFPCLHTEAETSNSHAHLYKIVYK